MATMEEELAKMNERMRMMQEQMAVISGIPKDKLPVSGSKPNTTPTEEGKKEGMTQEKKDHQQKEFMDEMMAVMKDVRDKLSEIQKAQTETQNEVLKNI